MYTKYVQKSAYISLTKEKKTATIETSLKRGRKTKNKIKQTSETNEWF